MNTEPIWTGEGELFRELSLHQHDDTFIGHFRKAVPEYKQDEVVTLTAKTVEDAIAEVQRYDGDYFTILTLYADEG